MYVHTTGQLLEVRLQTDQDNRRTVTNSLTLALSTCCMDSVQAAEYLLLSTDRSEAFLEMPKTLPLLPTSTLELNLKGSCILVKASITSHTCPNSRRQDTMSVVCPLVAADTVLVVGCEEDDPRQQ